MVKQYLAAVLEDLIGEYVLNISKENLKLAALKGKIKLDNVELDGDYIGSHVLGAVGLQGFGVISCYAKSLQIHIPWKNLDEPTSMEIHGMHLVCVPLLPTTATRMYYGGGISGGTSATHSSFHDVAPRCSLRTRAKRSAIARFERSFFSGRIPGEGPQIEKEETDNNTLNYNGRRQRWSLSVRDEEDVFNGGYDDDFMNDFSSSVNGFPGTINGSQHSDASATSSKQTLREKISTKIYQNLISSINDVHIRFEVPEGALDMSLTGRHDNHAKRRQDSNRERLVAADQKAFAFGLVLQRLSVQNVLEDVHKSQPTNLEDRSVKTIEISNMSIYWDDGPPFLLTESDSIKGLLSVPVQKLQKRIAEVMKVMVVRQDPGEDLRRKLNSLNSPARMPFTRKQKSNDFRAHEYICSNFSQTIHTIYTTETSGDTTYFVDLLPSKVDIDATSQQYRQYQLLKNAVLSQQRFDTMLHGRPKRSPLDDPRSWWRYAILCVQHRPNSRPWSDVQQIVRCRNQYINLVVKNLESETEQSGFHGGLSSSESQTLLGLENLLPIETLLAFHLLALRRVFDRRCAHKKTATSVKVSNHRKKKKSNLSKLWRSVNGPKDPFWRPLEDLEFDSPSVPQFPPSLDGQRSFLHARESFFQDNSFAADASQFHGEPMNMTKYRLHQSEIQISLVDLPKRTKIVSVEVALRGNSFNSGDGKEKYTWEILRFEVFDFVTSGALVKSKVLSVEPTCKIKPGIHQGATTIIQNEDTAAVDGSLVPVQIPSSLSAIEDLLSHIGNNEEFRCENLPFGVVCRVTALANDDDISLALVAHPATIVWNNACADAVAEFFYTSTPDVQIQFLNQLRSAATPGAHQRQLDILYPTSIHLSVDVHAPKLWFPVSSYTMDGALYLDAGKLKIAASKKKKTSDTRWGIDLNDIQIKFSREDNLIGSSPGTGASEYFHTIDLAAVNRLGNEFTIVYPFHIGVTGISTESVEIPLENSFISDPGSLDRSKESMSGEVSVEVGKIRLNLVDVEELAKALGRFYASQMIRLRAKSKKGSDFDSQIELHREQKSGADVLANSLAYEVSFSLQQIEVALESFARPKSTEKKASRNRTYLLTISNTTLQQRSKGLKQFSRLAISDISLVQLSEVKQGGRRVLKLGGEPQHQILGKKDSVTLDSDTHEDSDVTPPLTLTPKIKTEHRPLRTPRELRLNSTPNDSIAQFPVFIRACHFHDGENHVDEVEFDIIDVIVRVTPTSIVDLTKAATRLFELIQLTSKEMERKVHAGRRDKIRVSKSKQALINGLQATTLYPSASLHDDEQVKTDSRSTTDSSIIYRVTFKGASLFVGRPASEFTSSRASKRHGTAPHDYVIQVLTNASILIQSVENPDSSGSKTAHISLEDLSASISNAWTETIGPNQVVSPTEVDFRAVYQTVEEGSVVGQDFSFDCESIKCCMQPHDVTVIHSISRKVVEKLNALQVKDEADTNNKSIKGILPSLVYLKEKGSGIATSVRFELNSFSLVSVCAFESCQRPFLELSGDQLKLRLDGVAACFYGELSSSAKLSFYHPVSGWEHVIEPIHIHLDIAQMPDEQMFTITASDNINVNFTGYLLQELSNLDRSRKQSNLLPEYTSNHVSFLFTNCTGIDVYIGLTSSLDPDGIERAESCIKDGDCVSLESLFPELIGESHTISLDTTQRKPLLNLPLLPTPERCTFRYNWYSDSTESNTHDLEPVVEFVIENQRLRSSVADVYNLEKGRDMLSSTTWSPEFSSTGTYSNHLWQKPYLEGDAPEFSDMTCKREKTKDSIMLPGHDWMWVNDWEVEINDGLGIANDADGWEYSADFDTFNASRRSYKRGDLCRRRRWTRHRMMKPPKDGTYRMVWEMSKEENGYISIKARSHLTLHNNTSIPIAFFGYCPSWETDKFIGYASKEMSIHVPIHLACATHVILAVPKKTPIGDAPMLQIDDCFPSDRVMILSSGLDSNKILRTVITCDSSSTDKHGLKSLLNLHFMLRLTTSIEGVCDIYIDPALRLVNLLPCQMQCQLAESVGHTGLQGKKVVQTEDIKIAVGKDAKCLSLDCHLKPHISVRLPGYRWSSWNRIVNRHANSQTWLPLRDEQATLFGSQKDGTDEYKTVLHLDNKCTGGSSINLIMSVEAGHSPTIRIYAQYWVLDKTGFGLRFSDNFDIIGQKPDPESLRQSFFTLNTANTSTLAPDTKYQGYEWSIGMNGMTLFFSRKERVSFSVVHDEEVSSIQKRKYASRWSSFIDISKVISKTVISVDDHDGKKRFELAYDVTLCPSIFSRTLMITFFPRYQIANLLQENLYIAQDGTSGHPFQLIPSQSWVPFHWENATLPPKIRLSCDGEAGLWTRGCIALDQIGITAMRVPSAKKDKSSPFVVQVEVRLATKKQSSAVVVVIWSSIEKSNPLYSLRNNSLHTIFCSQPLLHGNSEENPVTRFECIPSDGMIDESNDKQTGGALGRIARSRGTKQNTPSSRDQSSLNLLVKKALRGECNGCNFSEQMGNENEREEFVWTLQPGETVGFGFDNPELPHLLEWTCLTSSALLLHGEDSDVGRIDLDVIGAKSSVMLLDGEEVKCEIRAEQSTKVISFGDSRMEANNFSDDDLISLSFRIDLPGITISIIDNISQVEQGKNTFANISGYEVNAPKEIILVSTEGWLCSFSQTRDGLHELEVKLQSLQADNFIFNAEHPVLIYTPKNENEPFAHCSVVRRLNEHESTFVISYAAIRVLELDICLDRKTTETLANFLFPFRKAREQEIDIDTWITSLTLKMSSNYSKRSRRAPRDIEKMIHSANSGRVYIENLHLHPIRLSLTFTQEWLEFNSAATEGLIMFQIIRGMASIADAPLTFTSFLVGNAFESPQSLREIIITHYSSQLTSQILPLLFNMAILKAPVEFVSNVGSGVIRFFYEPINALVYSPERFMEGVELGTHHLARGVFTGFVKGAANLTYLVNNNLVTLASDEAFSDTRRAYQKQIEKSRARTMEDSLNLAGACVARGFESGANGIFEQPAMYASRHGSVGLVKGVGKALVGAIVKPVVGIGDAAVVVMNHVGDATSERVIIIKEWKRMRRALPQISTSFGTSVDLIPYDTISAKAQRIVTGGETVDDTFLGHVTIPSHLIIASKQCLWTIDKDSRKPWCISWTEISHFSIDGGTSLTITVFSSQGPHSYVFDMSSVELADLYALLSMQTKKMGNMNTLGTMSYANLPGMKSKQAGHIFGSQNTNFKIQQSDLDSDVKLVERCIARVNLLSSATPDFFIRLDQEAWLLVNSSTQLFTGLSSRRCVSIGILNGANETIQIKSAKLVEGGSDCYIIPTREYDKWQGILEPGGAVIVFGWGAAPSLLQPGSVLVEIETNAFSCSISDRKNQVSIMSLPGYQVGFLEKSYDESGWWAKCWILITKEHESHRG